VEQFTPGNDNDNQDAHMVRSFLLSILCACAPLQALRAASFDAASAFGARESVSRLRLSPDGRSVSYVAPSTGQGAVLYTAKLDGKGARPVLNSDGKPYRISHCDWASNERLVCSVYGVVEADIGLVPVSRLIAVGADGSNVKVLSNQANDYTRGYLLGGGEVIDWLPDQNGAILMARQYAPDTHTGSHLGSDKEGLGVDLVDTRSLAIKQVEPPRRDAVWYIADGHGTVRVMALRERLPDENDSGTIRFMYRTPNSREWIRMGDYDTQNHTGFRPEAVDPTLNVAYGFKKKDGRMALYSVTLDGSLKEELVYARDDVDVDEVIRIGRRQRVVGASYATEIRHANYFAPDISGLVKALAKALPNRLLQIADSSIDDNYLLIYAGSDSDPGVYYILDRKTHNLQTFLVARGELEGVKLASQRPISYPATDGTRIPAYLTLPPGQESAKGLPAIVMPHGGPSSRDEWGFDWLAQFYASRGFAVLQPEYRGSEGFGDDWFEKNGFRSWPTAIGDILAGGHWLVSQGIADPSKVGIVGWSYGGYAALQSAIVEPGFFKAVVAIAPVTDLGMLKEEHRIFTDFKIVSNFVGDGPQLHEGSPAEHADRVTAPVLLFHGSHDRNVGIDESKRMASRLTDRGKSCKLITWDGLDHQLVDSQARAQMLRTSDEFLRQSMGMTGTATAAATP
jgi:dipeptidyl aminopeptidase/acylaminoacyl peptidase